MAASLAVWPLGLSPIYGVTAVVVGAFFLVEAHRLAGRARRGEPLKPMRLFHWSTTYLTILFLAVALDALGLTSLWSDRSRGAADFVQRDLRGRSAGCDPGQDASGLITEMMGQ